MAVCGGWRCAEFECCEPGVHAVRWTSALSHCFPMRLPPGTPSYESLQESKGALRMGFWRRLSVVCFALGGIVGAVLPADVDRAQTADSIVVEGARRVETNTIRSYFKPGRDGRLGPHEIDNAYKALIATGLFQDVRIDTRGGR